MVRIHIAVMVTVMQFPQFFFYESQVEELRKAFTKEKKNIKMQKNFYCCLLLLPKVRKFNKKWLSNKELGMVPKVPLNPNLK